MKLYFSVTAIMLVTLIACGPGSLDEDTLEQANVLFNAGRYAQALPLYEELCSDTSSYDPQLQFRLAETAVLASQSERNRGHRQRARAALEYLSVRPGDCDSMAIGQLWRRLGWEMARDNDSLQAYDAFGRAIEIAPEISQAYEEEWLLRGTYASSHLSAASGISDSIAGTPAADSLLALTAERHIVELDRVPLVRTDLRGSVLAAKVKLFQYARGRREDELAALTELDRMGLLAPGERQRRMEVLLLLADVDIENGDPFLARERLLEVWESNFTGVRVEAAYKLGLMAEDAGDPVDALMWYNRACSASPGLSSAAAASAAARRDSLRYLALP